MDTEFVDWRLDAASSRWWFIDTRERLAVRVETLGQTPAGLLDHYEKAGRRLDVLRLGTNLDMLKAGFRIDDGES